MDGEVGNCHNKGSDNEDLQAYNDRSGDSEEEDLSNVVEQFRLDDENGEPDGQRCSLSLEDDGGSTHFDSSLQAVETAIRRADPQQPVAMSQNSELSDDNSVVFNPVQRLDFEDDSDERGTPPTVGARESASPNAYRQRPLVHGSDDEFGDFTNYLPSSDQGQNIRIIEGHDSSILDDAGVLFQSSLNSPQLQSNAAALSHINDGEEDTNNLYDSLEREANSSPFRQSHELYENNPAEFFMENMSLVNSNINPESESMWPVVDSVDNRFLLPFNNNQIFTDGEQGHAGTSNTRQSPPRNFQMDTAGDFLSRADFFPQQPPSNLGCGDMNPSPSPNRDSLSLELSEEGLTNNTDTYAQPVANQNLSIAFQARGDEINPPNSQGNVDTNNSQQSATQKHKTPVSTNRQAVAVTKQGSPISEKDRMSPAANLQPKNLARVEKNVRVDTDSSVHSEGDGSDVGREERQAGAGQSASASSQNVTGILNSSTGGEPKGPIKKNVSGKAQARRPAVQGSASSDSSKGIPARATAASASTGAQPKKVQSNQSQNQREHTNRSTNNARKKATQEQRSSKFEKKIDKPTDSGSSVALGARGEPQPTNGSVGSTNSRVSGVGKESFKPIGGRPANQTSFGVLPQRPNRRDDSLSLSSTVNQNSVTQHREANRQVAGYLLTSGYPKHPQSNALNFDVSNSNAPANLVSYPVAQKQGLPKANLSTSQFNSQAQELPQKPGYIGFVSGLSPAKLESMSQYNQESVTYQGETGRKQGGYHTSPSHSESNFLSNDIQGMEDVRSHLQSMMRIGMEASMLSEPHDLNQSDSGADALLPEPPINRQLHFDSENSSVMGGHHPQEHIAEIMENFPSFSSKMFNTVSATASHSHNNIEAAAMQGENQFLRDNLEKERYRRKHCEDHIQKLNAKLLELQQQLAVAVSTDKRKDIMIEQLDKQLAKVVEGWKKRESEKDSYLKALSQEKSQIEENLHTQQVMINNFERDLSHTVEELRIEKERSATMINSLKEELSSLQKDRETSAQAMQEERDKCSHIISQWQDIVSAKDAAEQREQEAKKSLLSEKELWLKQEQEMQSNITEVKESSTAALNMEKLKLEEEKKKREELDTQCEELKGELKKVIVDIEQLLREKETQKVEMAIIEAKAESAQKKLEADLHSQMEKEIAEQAAEFHSKMETCMEEISDRHRKQVAELHARHQQDMEQQLMALSHDRNNKEEEYRRQLHELEESLQELRADNSLLKQSKMKLESQRMEILTKLQFMMQSQWNEAVSLLVNTPQKKNLGSSFLSGSSGSQLASALAMTDGNTSVTSLNLVSTAPTDIRSSSSSDRLNKMDNYLNRYTNQNELPLTRNDLQGNGQTENMSTGMSSSPSGQAKLSISSSSSLTRQDSATSSGRKRSSTYENGTKHGSQSKSQASSIPSETSPDSPPVDRCEQENPPSHFQAFAIRSPQQSTHLHAGLTSHQRRIGPAANLDENVFLLSYPSGQHTNSSTTPLPPDIMRPLAGDQGDHTDTILTSNTNINIYEPMNQGGPESSPNTVGWSPGSNHRIPSSVGSSPINAFVNGFPPSPIKKPRSRNVHGEQQLKGRLNDALSPPVKQAAEREEDEEEKTDTRLIFRQDINYSQLANQSRHAELQHYVKMLLEKAPSSVCSEPERDVAQVEQEFLESSRDLTEKLLAIKRMRQKDNEKVDLDLNDTAQAVELTAQLTRLQQLREQTTSHVGMTKSNETVPVHHPPSTRHQPAVATHQAEDSHVINAEGLKEISQLLSLYREQWECNPEQAQNANTAGQLMKVLKDLSISKSPQTTDRSDGKRQQSITKHSPKSINPTTRKTRELANRPAPSKPRNSQLTDHGNTAQTEYQTSNKPLNTGNRKHTTNQDKKTNAKTGKVWK